VILSFGDRIGDLAFVSNIQPDRQRIFFVDIDEVLHLFDIASGYNNTVVVLEKVFCQFASETCRTSRYKPNIFITHLSFSVIDLPYPTADVEALFFHISATISYDRSRAW